MGEEETIPKQAPLALDSEILEDASTTSGSNQPGILGRTDQSVSVPSATEADSSGTEIHRVDVTSSDDTTLSNGASNSTLDASHGVGDEQENEQLATEDDPSNPLIAPRYETDVPIRIAPRYGTCFPIRVVEYEIYEPPLPPRPSWIQRLCCCFLTAYYIHYARKIRNSKYIILVLAALFVIPLSALYFGIAYVDYCPLAPFSASFLTIMGILGIGVIGLRIMALSGRILGISLFDNKTIEFQMGVLGLMVLLMVLVTLGMVNFYIKYPNFYDPENPVYCNKTYYYYVLCMNWVVLVVGILGLLLHIPMKNFDPVQVVPLEYFETI